MVVDVLLLLFTSLFALYPWYMINHGVLVVLLLTLLASLTMSLTVKAWLLARRSRSLAPAPPSPCPPAPSPPRPLYSVPPPGHCGGST